MLKKRLSEGGADRPVVIFLDALDQLHWNGETKNLSWIPRHLPSHVKVVVSTLVDEECYENLKVCYLKTLFEFYDRWYMCTNCSRESKKKSKIIGSGLSL